MDENTSGLFWDSRLMDAPLTASEKALRDAFVAEYLKEGNSYVACLNVGFSDAFAREWAKKFMAESYVRREISRLELEPPEDPDKEKEADTRLVLRTLRRVMKNGKGSEQVQAATKLMSYHGLDAPIKTQQQIEHRGGVMMVPAISNIDEWEKAATSSQSKLVQEAQA